MKVRALEQGVHQHDVDGWIAFLGEYDAAGFEGASEDSIEDVTAVVAEGALQDFRWVEKCSHSYVLPKSGPTLVRKFQIGS